MLPQLLLALTVGLPGAREIPPLYCAPAGLEHFPPPYAVRMALDANDAYQRTLRDRMYWIWATGRIDDSRWHDEYSRCEHLLAETFDRREPWEQLRTLQAPPHPAEGEVFDYRPDYARTRLLGGPYGGGFLPRPIPED